MKMIIDTAHTGERFDCRNKRLYLSSENVAGQRYLAVVGLDDHRTGMRYIPPHLGTYPGYERLIRNLVRLKLTLCFGHSATCLITSSGFKGFHLLRHCILQM